MGLTLEFHIGGHLFTMSTKNVEYSEPRPSSQFHNYPILVPPFSPVMQWTSILALRWTLSE